MSLPWVRMDSNLPSHDKTLKALGMRGGKAAMAVDMFAICWAGGHATDGHIPTYALPAVHATAGDVRILVEVGLWDEDPDGEGWWIHNFGQRQEASAITESKRAKASEAGRRSGCVRRGHPAACTCWKQSTTSVRLVEG